MSAWENDKGVRMTFAVDARFVVVTMTRPGFEPKVRRYPTANEAAARTLASAKAKALPSTFKRVPEVES